MRKQSTTNERVLALMSTNTKRSNAASDRLRRDARRQEAHRLRNAPYVAPAPVDE